MPPPSANDRIHRSLLDKLATDRYEGTASGSLDAYLGTVLRDLCWLLNSVRLSETVDLEPYPEVKTSVINYGWIDLIGSMVTEERLPAFVGGLRRSLLDFEPRLNKASLRTRLLERRGVDRIMFAIQGELVVEPMSYLLLIQTEFDTSHGIARVTGDIKPRRSASGYEAS